MYAYFSKRTYGSLEEAYIWRLFPISPRLSLCKYVALKKKNVYIRNVTGRM